MAAHKRKPLTEEERQKIIDLLTRTDLTAVVIAKRFSCHNTVVLKINREMGIRPTPNLGRKKKAKSKAKFFSQEIKGGFL